MTPNEICREIVTRLQLGGGVHEDQLGCGEWCVRVMKGLCVYRFSDLSHVAEAIRAVKPYPGFHVGRDPGAMIGEKEAWISHIAGEGATEAEALTRALLEYLRANKIGEEYLQPPEPEEEG